jgi:DNA-binding transcriptional regulator LsrR (DeoR family)
MSVSNENSPVNLSAEEHRLTVKVAKLYYEDGLTQNEIAKMLGYSRIKIHRLLRTAKDAGIVNIQILTPDSDFYDLERLLIKNFNLRDALIVPTKSPGSELYLSLAGGAVSWLKMRLEDSIRVGLGLGRTISHLPQVFQVSDKISCTFTEIVGAASDYSQGFTNLNITSQMAEIAGGEAEFFYAPTVVSSPALKQKLIAEPSVKKALERARNCDIILQSVGPVDNSALLYLHGYLNDDDLQSLRDMGAVGDALGHYFDASGKPVRTLTDELMIGLELEDLRTVPWSVLIAGGDDKQVAIQAALRGDYFNVLITDEMTAQTLTLEAKNAE